MNTDYRGRPIELVGRCVRYFVAQTWTGEDMNRQIHKILKGKNNDTQ